MTPRQRVLAAISFEKPDLVPMHDSILLQTLERWRTEGFPEDAEPHSYFGYCIHGWGYDESLRLAERIIEETDEYLVRVNQNGVTEKILKGKNATNHPLEWSVKERADWERLKEVLVPSKERLPGNFEQLCSLSREKYYWVVTSVSGAYGLSWSLVGWEKFFFIMTDEPDWAHDMLSTYTDFTIGMCELMRKGGLEFEGVWHSEDIAYRNGPFFSPRMYRDFIFPYHRRLFGYFHDIGAKVLFHSDGFLVPLLPHLVEAGIDILDPNEAKAGMDIRRLADDYRGKISFMGNIDASIVAHHPEQIEEEVRSKLSAFAAGGYLYRMDGPVAEDISFPNYCKTIECVKKYGS